MGCKPCCCYSLKFSAVLTGIWTIVYGLVTMAVFAWRTAEISYKRERMLGALKPWDREDSRQFPGPYSTFTRTPDIAWYTAIFALAILKTVSGFFLIAGGVTLIWGVKAVIFWLVWFWIVVMIADILISFGYAIAWWTSQIRPQEQQKTLPVFEIIFVFINLYCLWIIFLAFRAMKRGEFSLKKKHREYVHPAREVVVDHSYDYDPFGAVFIEPFEKPRKQPPPTYYAQEEYTQPAKNTNHHIRPPLDPGVKKTVETYFTEPGRYTPEALPEKRVPDFGEGNSIRNGNIGQEREKFQGKFDRNPTPLPPKDANFDSDSVQDLLDEKARKNEFGLLENKFDKQLHTQGPVNLADLRLNYVPSEDSIKPARQIRLFGNLPGKEKDEKHRSKERRRHKSGELSRDRDRDKKHKNKHRSRDNSRDKDRDRDRESRHKKHRQHSRDRERDNDSKKRRSRSRHHSSRSPDRHRSDHDRRSERDRRSGSRGDRRRRSKSADGGRRNRRSRHRSSSPSTSSTSTSPVRPPPRQTVAPIVTRPSSGEDSALQSGSLPQAYFSDSDHHARNLQINSEIQISYPQRPPQPAGTAGTQLPLYTTSIPAPPSKPT